MILENVKANCRHLTLICTVAYYKDYKDGCFTITLEFKMRYCLSEMPNI